MMISRQRERISSNLTILMREHNKVANNSPSSVFPASSLASNSSSSSSNVCSWNTREKLLGVSGLNPSATSLFDFDREFIEEEVWGAVEESPFSDDYQAQQQHRSSTSNSSSNSSSNSRVDAENGSLLSKWRTGPASSRVNQAPLSRIQLQETSASTSKPMNVPDWSKILQNPNWTRGSRAAVEDQDDHSDKENDDQEWVPPHTLAAREHEARIRTSSIVAFSVLEGAGRTLKGRDLSRVRNAVWKQTGYMAV